MHRFLSECLKDIDVAASQEQKDKLLSFMRIVLEENKKYNLTSITDQKSFIVKHIADSLTVAPYIPDEDIKFIDIGSGAGLPFVPIKILKNNLKCTVVDSTKKKTDFISRVVVELGISKNAEVICVRAEELARHADYRERFDIVSARAVAPLSILVELCVPFIKPGGIFIAMKGKEVRDASSAVEKTGAKVLSVKKLTLPASDYERNIIIIKKISPTCDKYPRKYSQIKSGPL